MSHWRHSAPLHRAVAFVNGRRTVITGAQSLFKDLYDRAFDLRELGIGPIPYNERNPSTSGSPSNRPLNRAGLKTAPPRSREYGSCWSRRAR